MSIDHADTLLWSDYFSVALFFSIGLSVFLLLMCRSSDYNSFVNIFFPSTVCLFTLFMVLFDGQKFLVSMWFNLFIWLFKSWGGGGGTFCVLADPFNCL